MEKTAVERLRNGEKIVGTMIRMLRNPAVVPLAKFGNLDFIMLDLEHGAYTTENAEDIANIARAANVGIFARVPELSKSSVSRLMDAGVQGVMVPMISSAEEARKLVNWSRYAPVGNRGLGSNGPITEYRGVQTDTPTFMKEQNEETLVIAQIENVEALEEIDEIAAVEGIDVLLVGPNDLSISLGVPGELLGPEVTEAIGKIADAAEKHNKIFSIHAGDSVLEVWKDRMRMVMNSMDINVIGQGFAEIAKKYK